MGYDREAVFEAFGFEKKDGVWCFAREIEDGERSDMAAVSVRENEDGTLTGKILPSNRDFDSYGLYYISNDVADMIALAQNEIGVCTMEVLGEVTEHGFTHDGMWINMPFNNDPWADYGVAAMSVLDDGSKKFILRNPQEVYPEYDAWKAEFVNELMNTKAPKP